jgi:hypothetical protein
MWLALLCNQLCYSIGCQEAIVNHVVSSFLKNGNSRTRIELIEKMFEKLN